MTRAQTCCASAENFCLWRQLSTERKPELCVHRSFKWAKTSESIGILRLSEQHKIRQPWCSSLPLTCVYTFSIQHLIPICREQDDAVVVAADEFVLTRRYDTTSLFASKGRHPLNWPCIVLNESRGQYIVAVSKQQKKMDTSETTPGEEIRHTGRFYQGRWKIWQDITWLCCCRSGWTTCTRKQHNEHGNGHEKGHWFVRVRLKSNVMTILCLGHTEDNHRTREKKRTDRRANTSWVYRQHIEIRSESVSVDSHPWYTQ